MAGIEALPIPVGRGAGMQVPVVVAGRLRHLSCVNAVRSADRGEATDGPGVSHWRTKRYGGGPRTARSRKHALLTSQACDRSRA